MDGLETFTLQLVWGRINPLLILSNPPWHSFKKFLSPILETPLLSKIFLVPIHKRVYFAKLKRNWNASMCVEKQKIQDLQREKSIWSSTWWLLFFAWWAASLKWIWWLINHFSIESLCNFMGEGFEFFDCWVIKTFVLHLWKKNGVMVGFKCPTNFALKNYV